LLYCCIICSDSRNSEYRPGEGTGRPLDTQETADKSSTVVINGDRCKGCGFCVYICAKEVLAMSEETNQKGYLLPATVDEAKCSGCRLCEAICPDFALQVVTSGPETSTELDYE
jgi:2-oxoglutarate ferredoxin oxidoreductase subunit delta